MDSERKFPPTYFEATVIVPFPNIDYELGDLGKFSCFKLGK